LVDVDFECDLEELLLEVVDLDVTVDDDVDLRASIKTCCRR
jgi:hypothetical protein